MIMIRAMYYPRVLLTWFCLLIALGFDGHTIFVRADGSEPTSQDIVYSKSDHRSLTLDFYSPAALNGSAAPLVIWIHGGAWRSGSKDNVPVLRWLEKGFAIVSVDYRLSPEAPFPAQIHDIKSAIRFMREHASEYAVNPTKFVLAGASAGGHLAALAGVSSHPSLEGEDTQRSRESSRVQAIVSFYGASNLQSILSQSTEYGLGVRVPALQLFLGGQPDAKPDLARLASPVSHVDSTDPPLWLIHGDADPQMPFAQSRELEAIYRKHAVPVVLEVIPEGKHGGSVFFEASRLDNIAEQILAGL